MNEQDFQFRRQRTQFRYSGLFNNCCCHHVRKHFSNNHKNLLHNNAQTMSTTRFTFCSLLMFISSLQDTLSLFPFSLHIPSSSKCASCKFIWPTTWHYGYSFTIDAADTSIDVDSGLVTFSSIAINYDSYNSTDVTCNGASGFIEDLGYQISIYYRQSTAASWRAMATKSGHIMVGVDQSVPDIALNDISSIALISGEWYIGLRLSWLLLSQQCDC